MQVGGYEILSEIGRGGAGVVYRARGPRGEDVAVKVLATNDAPRLARFERERRLLASFTEADGFVPLLDAGKTEGGAFLVMPFVRGGTLRKRLESGPLSVDQTLALGRALARALEVAHERGIVHRDLKPENVLFAADGRPLVSDLGLAKHFDRLAAGGSGSVSLSIGGVFRGTPGYMPPEQMDDASLVGPATDVFALGAVLWECLSGRPAFMGETLLDLMSKVIDGAREPLARTDVPAWLEAVLARALATDPRKRFVDARALGRALEHAEQGARPAGERRPIGPLMAGATFGLVGVAAFAVFTFAPEKRSPAAPPRREIAVVRSQVSVSKPTGTLKRPSRSLKEVIADYNACVAAEDWDGAIEVCSAAMSIHAADASLLAARGVARFKKKDWNGAIEDATRAIELDPTLARAWCGRAAARNEEGDSDGALADATRAIELEPTLAAAWTCRALARRKQGDWVPAIADATRAIELDRTSLSAWRSRAVARIRSGDTKGGLEDAEMLILLDPKEPSDWMLRASAREVSGDLEGALADYERVLELAPDSPDVPATRERIAAVKAKLGR